MARRRMVVWQGISELDGVTPIVVLATYNDNPKGKSSDNAKTGDMIQLWILRDDMKPLDALKAGKDGAICGTCPHRSSKSGGSDACYVNVGQGPNSTYKAYDRNRNGDHGKDGKSVTLPFNLEAFRDRKVRFGAYGDPGAVPFDVWGEIANVAHAVTGYTHAWRTADEKFSLYFMASADSIAEGVQARKQGYRSFIVRAAGSPKPKGSVTCPASAEAGKRTVCADCLQCGGTSNKRRADITIEAHGRMAGKFRPLPLFV